MNFRAVDLKQLIDDFGKACTFTAKSLGAYDPTTGTLSGGSGTDYTVNIYFSNYNITELDGNRVINGDRRALFPLVDTSDVAIPEPEIGDEISDEGDTVSVVSIQKIMSGNSPICYICQVRE